VSALRKTVVVKRYKGDMQLQRGLRTMEKRGYQVENQATRKAAFSATAGIFTRKQIHTVTFRRQRSERRHVWDKITASSGHG
jgi:hypothetical protein